MDGVRCLACVLPLVVGVVEVLCNGAGMVMPDTCKFPEVYYHVGIAPVAMGVCFGR